MARPDRMRKFEGEERISGGALVKALEQRTRQSQVETCLDQALQRPEAEPAGIAVREARAQARESREHRDQHDRGDDHRDEPEHAPPQPGRLDLGRGREILGSG